MKNFAIVGIAGYIAPRHVKAIKDTGNNLVATLDPFDSVGFLDANFPQADYFYEFERFERHVNKLKRTENNINYVSICSPNYLHDSHIRFALRNNAHAICEKPLVLNPWNIDSLREMEKDYGKKIYNILQLRLHPSIIALKKEIDADKSDKIYDIDLTYITSRGRWYDFSWKGLPQKSGGIATNIGVHFFDMLTWIFGDVERNEVHIHDDRTAAGFLKLKKARVKWFLSIEYENIPEKIQKLGQRTYRSITVENKEIEFSGGFTDLHTRSYSHILEGKGFGLDAAEKSISIVQKIRNSTPLGIREESHDYAKKYLKN